MNNIIKNVLDSVANDQINLASNAARSMLAIKIAGALHNEINIRKTSDVNNSK